MTGRDGWDGGDYARRIEERLRSVEAAGGSRHGEADLVVSFEPGTVLDAGCGTGRVALELDRRGIAVTGVDVDASMLDTARQQPSDVEWIRADLVGLHLDRTFDVVVLAGNVPLFTTPGTEDALVRSAAQHVSVGGHLISGFQLGRYSLDAYDRSCSDAGLEPAARWSTWHGDAFDPESADYAVSVHRRPAAG